MRRQVLIASVVRHVGADTALIDAAYAWRRHRWSVAYAIAAAVALAVVGALAGFTSVGGLIGIGAAGGAVAIIASTDYRVIARTDRELIILAGSRVRHVAVGVVDRLPAATKVELIGNQFVITEWSVGGTRYSVPKSSERAMTRIAAA